MEVPRAALDAELTRVGAVTSLALVEAIARHAPRDAAIRRLARGLDSLAGTIGLSTLSWLVRLSAREALPQLRAAQATGPLAITLHVATLLLADEVDALTDELARDDTLLLRVPFVLSALTTVPRGSERLFAALLDAVARMQPTLGATAYRSLLGDLAEALFRLVQHDGNAAVLLGAHRDALVDRLTSELSGTTDLVAARGMAWLLGALAGNDDSARAAIERSRDRFRDEDFHADCAAILDGRWPPPPPA